MNDLKAEQKDPELNQINHFVEKVHELSAKLSTLKDNTQTKAEYREIRNGYLELLLLAVLDRIERLQAIAASASSDAEKEGCIKKIQDAQTILDDIVTKSPSAIIVFYPEVLSRLKMSEIHKGMKIADWLNDPRNADIKKWLSGIAYKRYFKLDTHLVKVAGPLTVKTLHATGMPDFNPPTGTESKAISSAAPAISSVKAANNQTKSVSDQKHSQAHPHQRKPAFDLRPSAIANANLGARKAEAKTTPPATVKIAHDAHLVFHPATGSKKNAQSAAPAIISASASSGRLVFVPKTTQEQLRKPAKKS